MAAPVGEVTTPIRCGVFGSARQQVNARDGRNRAECLAAKTERCDGEQIVAGANFRCCMAFKGEQRIVADHAAAVVLDANQLAATGFDIDANVSRARVQCVLQQLFHDRRGALDYLAGRNLVGDVVAQDSDASHGVGLAAAAAAQFVLRL